MSKFDFTSSFDFGKAKKIIIKVGTSTLTYGTGMINLRRMEALVKVLADIKNSGRQIVLVSSGAVSAGFAKLGIVARSEIEEKQAAAAVGQCELMDMYSRLFAEYGHTVAQILMTKDVLDDEYRRNNARQTFAALIEKNCIPIVNENDCLSCEGLRFGGNDLLSAYVAVLINADLVINMSDIDGLFDKNPREHDDAKLINLVEGIDEKVESFAGGSGTSRGTGGMKAKLEAVKLSLATDAPMAIVNGTDPKILYDVIEGKFRGTLFI